ncbi:MAG: sensor histidine kinase [Acidobacteriota bacterium]
MERERLGRPIRAALFLGFGLVVGIWLFAGYYFTRRIADVERQGVAINARYVHAQELLSTVRTQVLLGSVYVRDALLDPDPTTAGNYRRRLEDSYTVVDDALRQYVPVLDSIAERDQVARLRGEIADFRTTMLDVLSTDARRWPTEARTLLRARVMPKREMVIGLSEQTQSLNRGAFVQQRSAMTEVYSVTQRRIWQSLGVALAASLGIAVLATLYAGRLEDRLRRQRAKDVQNTRDLQHLSTKLLNAQEEERRSIARELHDEVGQALTAMKVELALAQRAIGVAGGAAEALDDARAIADGVLHTVRDLSHLLHPSLLDDLGLPDATEWYLKGFSRRHGLRTELLHDRMDQRLSSETEAAVYRIIQEALTNVAKHANATSCRVYLQRLTATLLVTIEDDGVGFDLANTRGANGAHGLGLVGIRERVAQLRGTVRLESGAGKGTRLTAEVPAEARMSEGDIPIVGHSRHETNPATPLGGLGG